ncbi:MAG: hypothetical protein IJZ57_07390 [Clostridia bacterium]|nr:hypothetical protein [Clostridia bacterium]
MKFKKYLLFLLFEAVGGIGITKVMRVKAESVFELLSYPLVKMADFLGAMSLSGSIGNAAAILIYSLFCLIPVFVMLFRMKNKTFTKIDSLLVLISAVLFVVVYLLINPSEMGLHGLGEEASMVAFSFWSLLVGYLVLKFADIVKNTEGKRTEKLLSLVLKITGAVFVFAICSAELVTTEIGIVTVLSFANTILPSIFGVLIVIYCLNVLSEFALDRYSENTLKAIEKLSSVCILALRVTVSVTALFSVLQLRFINELSNVNFSVDIPILSFGFILLVLILSNFLKDSKALKEDNDSFI